MIHTDTEIDWMACDLIERISGKVSGQPIVRGTRILPDAIVNGYDLGESIEDIHAAVRELKELGLIDDKGNRIRKDLPEEMKEGAERDFGG